MGGLLRSPRRKGRLGPRAFSRSICLNPPFGAPCFKLPLGRAGARARRAAQGGRHCGAARGGWPARAGGALCGVAAGLSRERGAGVGALSTKHLRSGAGRQLLCNLSPSRTGAVSLRRRRGLHLGRSGRRQRPKAVALGPGTCRAPSPLPSLPLGTPALGGRGWPAVAEGRGAARLTWRPRGCGVPGEVSARAALRRVGVGRPGRRTAGVLVSANSLRGFPGSCSGGLLSRISPLISPYFPSPFLLSLPPPAKFRASAMRWVWLPSKL